MEFNDVLKKRRSIRHFLDHKVSRDSLIKLIQAAHLAPSSCNLQLTQYIIVDDPDLMADLKKNVSYKFGYAPACILVFYDPRFTKKRSSVISSASMAAQNILLAATDLGLATCAMAGFEKDKTIKKILGIPDLFEILLLISVGYEKTNHTNLPPFKIPLDNILSFNKYKYSNLINAGWKLDMQDAKDIINYRSRISTVYLDRFRLNSYPESYTTKVFENFLEFFGKKDTLSVIDIMSYDGIFLKFLMKHGINASASDYLQNNLDFFANQFNCNIFRINTDNSLVNINQKFDIATLVFQAEFTPEIHKLLKNMGEVVKENGFVYLATIRESWYLRLARGIMTAFKKYILGKTINIYEENVFYKIGPRKLINLGFLKRTFEGINFSLVKKEEIKMGNGKSILVAIFSKGV